MAKTSIVRLQSSAIQQSNQRCIARNMPVCDSDAGHDIEFCLTAVRLLRVTLAPCWCILLWAWQNIPWSSVLLMLQSPYPIRNASYYGLFCMYTPWWDLLKFARGPAFRIWRRWNRKYWVADTEESRYYQIGDLPCRARSSRAACKSFVCLILIQSRGVVMNNDGGVCPWFRSGYRHARLRIWTDS